MNKNKKVIIPRPVCRRCHCQPVARGLEICHGCANAAIRLMGQRSGTCLGDNPKWQAWTAEFAAKAVA